MHKVSSLVQQASKEITQAKDGQTDSIPSKTPGTTSLTETDQKIVDRLFVRLQAIFPKWREIWTSDGELKAAKKQWTRAIAVKGLADPQIIKLGIEKAEIIGWVRPPSPAQFCEWCIDGAKEKAGIPSKENAVSQVMAVARKSDYARKRTKLSPSVYQMCRFIDWYDFQKLNVEKATKAAERAYDQMIEHWRSGREFAEQPTMIEHTNPSGVVTKASRQRGKETLASLKEALK